MPFQMRTTTIAAAASDEGIRCYTTGGDGDIREGCLDLHVHTIAAATYQGNRSSRRSAWDLVREPIEHEWHLPINRLDRNIVDQADGWYPGQFRHACDPGSTLCAFAWISSTWARTVFYQTSDACIREARFDGSWQDTPFELSGCLPGTDMAEIHTRWGERVMLFYQDAEGFLCYRRANEWEWDPSVRICKAAISTGLAATAWDEQMEHIRVYYQDETNTLCEYCGSWDGPWTAGAIVRTFNNPLGTLAAINYLGDNDAIEIRIYVQENDEIIELCQSGGGGWFRGHFEEKALPNSDIVAIRRTIKTGHLVNVLWAGPDQILHQRVLAPNLFWLDSTPIGYLTNAGTYCGCWSGTHFSDNDSNIDHKKIKSISLRSGDVLDGISLGFTDGSSTPWRGGQGGVASQFILADDEDITQVAVSHSGTQIQRLKFITSNGRESSWYGNQGGPFEVWSFQGNALAGFAGAFDAYVNGMMPLWSERKSKIAPSALGDLIAEAETMGNSIQSSQTKCTGFQKQSDNIQRQISVDLQSPGTLALQGVNMLLGTMEGLYQAQSDISRRDDLAQMVAKCKGQGHVVGVRFKDLHEQAQGIMKCATNLNTDVTYESSQTHGRIKRAADMQCIVAAMRKGAEILRQLKVDRVNDARNSIEKARQTRAEAERNRESQKTTRVIRDIFTFGLGEIGDWGNINAAIDYANKLIESSENALRASEAGLSDAQSELAKMDAELNRFTKLKSTLDAYGPPLLAQVELTAVLRDRCLNLVNLTLDVSLFLGSLAAKTETLELHCTAQQFAQSVLSITKLIGTVAVINVSVVNQPDVMRRSLQLIASTPVDATGLDDMM